MRELKLRYKWKGTEQMIIYVLATALAILVILSVFLIIGCRLWGVENKKLKKERYKVIRFWEHEIYNEPLKCLEKIIIR